LHSDMLIFDIMVTLVAFALAVFSLTALNIMRKHDVKKTLWRPVLLSGSLFIVMGILHSIYSLLDIRFFMVLSHVITFIALTILTYGVYVYVKLVKKGGKVIFIPVTEGRKGEG